MSERMDKFRDNVRARLADVDDRISSFKSGLDSAKDDINSRLDKARAVLEEHKSEAEQAQARARSMLEEKKAQTDARIEQWVHDRDVEKMEARAQLAEDYAAEQVMLAAAAVEEADLATLEALAARIEADEVAAG